MRILKAGDVRKEGDKVRRVRSGCNLSKFFYPKYDLNFYPVPTSMLGKPILPTDLIVSEYIRP